METPVNTNAAPVSNPNQAILQSIQAKDKEAALIGRGGLAAFEDAVSVQLDDVYKGLSVLGQEIVAKLDEILADKLPEGIKSLKPEEHTPEATADRIFEGVARLFQAFARGREGEGEAVVDEFMKAARAGVQEGYEDAVAILESIGAFEVEGIKEGVELTMKLLGEKLDAFETQLKSEYSSSETKESGEDSEEVKTKTEVPGTLPGASAPRAPQAELRLAA